MNSVQHKPAVKFGVVYHTDEEQGSKSTHAFMARYPELNVGVVLDNDVGGDIGVIINKCKNPVFVRPDGGVPGARVDAVGHGLDAPTGC